MVVSVMTFLILLVIRNSSTRSMMMLESSGYLIQCLRDKVLLIVKTTAHLRGTWLSCLMGSWSWSMRLLISMKESARAKTLMTNVTVKSRELTAEKIVISRMDESRGEWVKAETEFDGIIFLGDYCSFSFSAQEFKKGCKGTRAFYSDPYVFEPRGKRSRIFTMTVITYKIKIAKERKICGDVFCDLFFLFWGNLGNFYN